MVMDGQRRCGRDFRHLLWNRADRCIGRTGGRAAVVMDGQRRCGRDFRHLSWNRADRRIDRAGGGAAVVMDGQRRCGRDFRHLLWNRADRLIDRAGGRAAVVMDGQGFVTFKNKGKMLPLSGRKAEKRRFGRDKVKRMMRGTKNGKNEL